MAVLFFLYSPWDICNGSKGCSSFKAENISSFGFNSVNT